VSSLQLFLLLCPSLPGSTLPISSFYQGTYEQFKEYVDQIDNIGLQEGSIDVALVDGRARLSCAIKLLPYLHNNSIVIIHDFWVRPYYFDVLNYYDEVKSVKHGQSVIVMRPKPRSQIKELSMKTFGKDYPPPDLQRPRS
jgi:hypothetical protein